MAADRRNDQTVGGLYRTTGRLGKGEVDSTSVRSWSSVWYGSLSDGIVTPDWERSVAMVEVGQRGVATGM